MSDILSIIVFSGFGFWFLLFPQNVIKFYSWFHKGEINWTTKQVRLSGLLWLILFAVAVISSWQKLKFQ